MGMWHFLGSVVIRGRCLKKIAETKGRERHLSRNVLISYQTAVSKCRNSGSQTNHILKSKYCIS